MTLNVLSVLIKLIRPKCRIFPAEKDIAFELCYTIQVTYPEGFCLLSLEEGYYNLSTDLIPFKFSNFIRTLQRNCSSGSLSTSLRWRKLNLVIFFLFLYGLLIYDPYLYFMLVRSFR